MFIAKLLPSKSQKSLYLTLASPYLYCLNSEKQSSIQVIRLRHRSKFHGIPESGRICGCFMREVYQKFLTFLENIMASKITVSMSTNIPMVELSAREGSDEMKCHVATMGSIFDLVGDRVHGWDRSSSFVTRFEVTRIGLGAIITLSWVMVGEVLDKSGGVLRRGTPEQE